tara:strand:+ start:1004 stop:1138 length:135 start_codon:yes stop_codon:yes gene_type:complete
LQDGTGLDILVERWRAGWQSSEWRGVVDALWRAGAVYEKEVRLY